MTSGTVFVSHRAEYGKLVRELQKAIEKTSRGKEVFISEDIPRREKVVSDQGLRGENLARFRTAFETLNLMSLEFLSRCWVTCRG
jgi:hypothetical protein